jgi:hypothetical protein
MATTNPVFQVLVTSGNQAILAKDLKPEALKGGQLGFFNYHTGLSIDGTVAGDYQDYFIAVGVNRGTAGNVADDVNFSSGQMIQRRHTKAITLKGYIDEAPQVTDITDFVAYCETDYTIKIEIRTAQLYQINGYNANSKTYTYRTGCCAQGDCNDCSNTGDCNELVNGLIALINGDPDHWVVASATSSAITTTITAGASAIGNTVVTVGSKTYTVPVTSGDTAAVVAGKIAAFVNADTSSPYKATASGANLTFVATNPKAADLGVAGATVSGSGVTASAGTKATTTPVTDTAAYATAYPGACMGIRITGVVKSRTAFNGSIPAGYYSGGMAFVVSLPTSSYGSGFGLCNGKVATVTEPTYPEGKGIDVQWDEYVAGGWNGKPGPYRTSALLGLQKGTGFEYFANPATNYHQAVIEYDQMSVGGWLEYLNNLETIINVPTTDAATWTGLFTVLDLIYTNTGFTSNADDAAQVVTQPVVHKINDYTKDGITTLG